MSKNQTIENKEKGNIMSLDMNKLQAQKDLLTQELSRGSSKSALFWRPADGPNVIRILPGWTDEEPYKGSFWREVAQHWNFYPDQKGPILCTKYTKDLDGACPVCEFVDALKQDKNNVKAQLLVKDIRAKTTYFLNIIDMEDPVYNAKDVAEYKKARPDKEVPFKAGSSKIQVYACTKTIFNQILNFIMQGKHDITDLNEGNEITIDKRGSGVTGTKYTVTPAFKGGPAELTEDAEFVALDQVGYTMPYEELLNTLSNGVGGDFVDALPSGAKHSLGSSSYLDTTNDESEDSMGADELEAEMRQQLSNG